MSGDAGADYLLDNQQDEAGRRFAAFAELFDPATFRHLRRWTRSSSEVLMSAIFTGQFT